MLLGWRFRQRSPAQAEEAEAKALWNRYAKQLLAHNQEWIEGKRVSIEYQARYGGTHQAAAILKAGLEDLGAQIVGMGEPHDVHVQIRRYSGEDGSYVLLDEKGSEVHRGVVHHEYLVSEVVEGIARYAEEQS
jgi:hypothetical protein